MFGGTRLKKQHDDIPEVSISLNKKYRGFGIGTELMKRMLKLLKCKGYKKASLTYKRTIMRCVCIIRQDSKLLMKL
ncbi:GNAT family N-acetyltransferase [Lacrimispora sphenoides]|uniref:GNAT family N-acetyltransferase n=1 Tax=Lacrimispora sphenoides TaxID=29370 RepID=UPI00241D036D